MDNKVFFPLRKLAAGVGLKLLFPAVALLFSSTPAFAEHDFTIQGQFTYTAQGVTMPVEGAIVGIMRDKSWAADPIVAEVRTAPDGTFSAQVKAKDVDTYYAKLFLNDKQGVFLHDWWTLSVREYNSATRGKNKTALVDLGGTDISRDGGQGTPECAIWQGGRRAWQEYVAITGERPLIGEHGNYQITMESTDSGIVWTSRDTTHWEMNNGTGEYSKVTAVANPTKLSYADLFQLYGTSVHEFGHALRQTADGSDNHFYWDATRFFYGHAHQLCDSSPTGVRDNAGYGFNEGWADYWQGTSIIVLQNCINQHGGSFTNFDQEAVVALDLDALQDALGSGAGIPSDVHGDELIARRRALMFQTLSGAGHEKIHSENEFREAWARRFPACTLPAPGALSASVRITPAPTFAPHSSVALRDPRLASVEARMAALPAEIGDANVAVGNLSPSLPHDQRTMILTRPELLRGQMAYAQLLAAHLRSATANPPSPAFLMTEAGERQRAAQVAQFDDDARKISLNMLNNERTVLLADDKTSLADDIAMLDAQIASVQSGEVTVTSHMLSATAGPSSESISAKPLITFH